MSDNNDILKINKYVEKFIKNDIQILPIQLELEKRDGEWKKKPNFKVKGWQQMKNAEHSKSYYNYEFKEKKIYGIKTGKVNNITVVDIDTKDEKLIKPILEDLKIKNIEDTLSVETKNGFHLYFKYNDKLNQTQGYAKEKYGHENIDIRGDNGCVFCPPSFYKIENDKYKYRPYKLKFNDFIDKIKNNDMLEIPESFIIDKPKENKSSKDKPTKDKAIKPLIKNEPYKLSEKNKKYLELIPADNRDDWWQVGSVLVRLGCEQKVWDEWSKKSPKFCQKANDERWESLKKYNYNEKTLEFKAFKYNETKARHIKVSLYENIVDRFMKSNKSEYSMAILINDIKNVYCYEETATKKAFLIPNDFNKWEKKQVEEIGRFLSEDVYNIFLEKVIYERRLMANLEDEEEKERKQKYVSILLNFTNGLQNTTAKNGFIKQLKDKTYDGEIFSKLDEENLFLLNFDNGCYDFEKSTFRLPKVDEYVSKTCGYDYTDEIDEEIREQIFNLLNKVWKDETDDTFELRDYNLKVIASCLVGYNKYESFYCWTGTGGNGKGGVDKLNKITFGEYYDVIDKTYFTQAKKSSAQADPELAGKKGIRMLVSTETERTEEFQSGKLKLLSGNDEISTRGLYQSQTSFTPQFTMFFQCNGLPNLSQIDGGIKRRAKMVEFTTQFKNNPDENQRYEEQKDTTLKHYLQKDKRYRQQYMLILIEYYNKYIKDDENGEIETPKIVQEYTENYLFDNDIMGQFMRELGGEITHISTDIFKRPMLWELFRSGYKSNNEDCNMGKQDFFKMVKNYEGIKEVRKSDGIYFTGLKFPTEALQEHLK